MTKAGRAPSAWLIPVVLKKPSPELPFKKIGQNTHVIHSISLEIPTGWLKNQAQSSYASEWVWFFALDHVSLKATWPCSKSAFPPAQLRGDPMGCSTTIPESLCSVTDATSILYKAQDWEVDDRNVEPTLSFPFLPRRVHMPNVWLCPLIWKPPKPPLIGSFLILQFLKDLIPQKTNEWRSSFNFHQGLLLNGWTMRRRVEFVHSAFFFF